MISIEIKTRMTTSTSSEAKLPQNLPKAVRLPWMFFYIAVHLELDRKKIKISPKMCLTDGQTDILNNRVASLILKRWLVLEIMIIMFL